MTTDVTDSHVDLEGRGESSWADLDAYIALPRLSGLHLSPDGSQLVVGISKLDHTKTSYIASLWRVGLTPTERPRRLTRSLDGESVAAFTHGGDLLFTSKRELPKDGDFPDTVKALWCLPAAGGEAYPWARRDGGWSGIWCAADSDRVVAMAPRHRHTASEEADAELRKQRKDLKVSALLHEGYPVRFWDHDLGADVNVLLTGEVRPDAEGCADGSLAEIDTHLASELEKVTWLSADGSFVLAEWRTDLPRGRRTQSVVRIDTSTGERTVLAQGDEHFEFAGGRVSRDGRWCALTRWQVNTSEKAPQIHACLVDLASGDLTVLATEWDRWPEIHGIAPDGSTLVVSADDDGNHPLFVIDCGTGEVRRVTESGAFHDVAVSEDALVAYAIRSSYSCPGEVVRVELLSGDVTVLDSGVTYPELPGTLERVETTGVDGTRVAGYLALPEGEGPHPLAVWIHGGPLGSWNDWSWRWCPWLLVAQGYAVALPDPALSTGYGQQFIERGWGSWGEAPYTDVMAFTDAVVSRPDIDGAHTCAMGGSFGGYMANWVATHTDRFKAIVTHASLWNLEAFGPTTDSPDYWMTEMTPEMMTKNSPHRFVESLATPMLVIHGDKDYRVPLGEGLALWWALIDSHEGEPSELPHRFLYFPDENHWILKPQHAVVWYQTVKSFLDWHVLGKEFARPAAI